MTEWKLRKNISNTKVKAIIHIRDKRKREGKDTDFLFHGRPVEEERIERANKRHRPGGMEESSSPVGKCNLSMPKSLIQLAFMSLLED